MGIDWELSVCMAYFLERTALKPNVKLDIIAVVKPSQLKDKSEAEAMPTPACTRFILSKMLS